MKEVKISKNLIEAYNNFEGFMFVNCVKVIDEDGGTSFAFADPSRASELRSKFEELCDTYHHLIDIEAEANGVIPSVIEDYFNSVCYRKKDLFDWQKFIKDYTFNVEGTIKF